MLTKADIENLSVLARVAVSDEEKESFAVQLDSVLAYVSDIRKVATADAGALFEAQTPLARAGELRNVTRPDTEPAEGGSYTSAILANAPDSEDGYVKVAKII
jgi:aspartyl-tRNA(Asn)/glutamyl-tRNA(Gln) amidotransferase subunit C